MLRGGIVAQAVNHSVPVMTKRDEIMEMCR